MYWRQRLYVGSAVGGALFVVATIPAMRELPIGAFPYLWLSFVPVVLSVAFANSPLQRACSLLFVAALAGVFFLNYRIGFMRMKLIGVERSQDQLARSIVHYALQHGDRYPDWKYSPTSRGYRIPTLAEPSLVAPPKGSLDDPFADRGQPYAYVTDGTTFVLASVGPDGRLDADLLAVCAAVSAGSSMYAFQDLQFSTRKRRDGHGDILKIVPEK